ncbi:ABC transporter ATP-binding protein [Granulosicoccus sp. 3-233]|uniref:ABC transporter ATP-binding protein n=1 Tax=Granulosicoccus sp. 3-233 TaxID=3417969 RepID=UPI003D327DE4
MSHSPGIALNKVSLNLGSHPIFQDLSLHLEAGKWHSLLGRSGIGKTSLLRIIAGLQQPDEGSVLTDAGKPVSSRIAYMAQDDGLLPWLTARQNIQLGPRLRGERLQDTDHRVSELLERVGLSSWADALPAVLSGGMRQRVALARTLLEHRDIVLMDEPFSRLDAITRDELQSLSFELLSGHTVLLVTHDPMEALRLSHALHVLEPGSPTRVQSMPLRTQPPRQLDHEEIASRLPAVWQFMKNGENRPVPA